MKKKVAILGLALLFALAFTTVETFGQSADRPLKIIKKPTAPVGGCSQPSGTARVRATFGSDEVVSNVEITRSSGCQAYDRNVVKAALKIKFLPAIKDGVLVSVTKQIEYVFAIY